MSIQRISCLETPGNWHNIALKASLQCNIIRNILIHSAFKATITTIDLQLTPSKVKRSTVWIWIYEHGLKVDFGIKDRRTVRGHLQRRVPVRGGEGQGAGQGASRQEHHLEMCVFLQQKWFIFHFIPCPVNHNDKDHFSQLVFVTLACFLWYAIHFSDVKRRRIKTQTKKQSLKILLCHFLTCVGRIISLLSIWTTFFSVSGLNGKGWFKQDDLHQRQQ